MKKEQFHKSSGCRYDYDFGPCTTAEGWAQVDTAQDASYFGNWTNPFKREWFAYVEGDITHVTCDTDEEYVAYVKVSMAWYEKHDGKPAHFDPGFNKELKAKFKEIGLGEFLWQEVE